MHIDEMIERSNTNFLQRLAAWQERIDISKLKRLRRYVKQEILKVPEGGRMEELDLRFLQDIDYLVGQALRTPAEHEEALRRWVEG